jgi:hypothetical protein
MLPTLVPLPLAAVFNAVPIVPPLLLTQKRLVPSSVSPDGLLTLEPWK